MVEKILARNTSQLHNNNKHNNRNKMKTRFTTRYMLNIERQKFEHEIWGKLQFLAKLSVVELDNLKIEKYIVKNPTTQKLALMERVEDKENLRGTITTYTAEKDQEFAREYMRGLFEEQDLISDRLRKIEDEK